MNITREQFKKLAKKHLIALQGYDVNETIEIFGVGKLYDDIVEIENTDLNTEQVTRIEVIDDTGTSIHSTDWNGKCFKCGEQVFVREPK